MTYQQRKTIRENYSKFNGGCPYKYFDWITILTPIEINVWTDIRILGLPFYPQYPVGGYFLDFGNPILRFGIEVDSKQWHTNKQADQFREQRLNEYGWRLIRIQGYQTFDKPNETFSESYKNLSKLKDLLAERLETPS